MEKEYVLFSGVGSSDPWKYSADGSMLHIIRHYQPKYAILFFTKAIWEDVNERTGHHGYDWDKIIKEVSPETEIKIVVEDIKNLTTTMDLKMNSINT